MKQVDMGAKVQGRNKPLTFVVLRHEEQVQQEDGRASMSVLVHIIAFSKNLPWG